MNIIKQKIELGNIPFFFRHLNSPDNDANIPNRLPFTLAYNPDLGLIIQEYNEITDNFLSKAYKLGSEISGMMEDEGIGNEYAEDFLNFIANHLKLDSLKGKKILEIGCGTGYLLSRLSEYGAEVLGIEPGIQGQSGSEKYGVRIINDFFPSSEINDEFDVIIAYGVLEHINNPAKFLENINQYLKKDGVVFFAVPDSEPYLKTGDLSFLLHEHWNYFTKNSLEYVLIEEIAAQCMAVSSDFGGLIYSVYKKDANKSVFLKTDRKNMISKEDLLFKTFNDKYNSQITCIKSFFEKMNGNEKTFGIYVPGRFINVLSKLEDDINLNKIRFFDDNKSLYGTFFPSFLIRVEDRNDLIANPPDVLIIFSNTFGKKILSEIKDKIDSGIYLIEDILNGKYCMY